jgi:hypothetical protein
MVPKVVPFGTIYRVYQVPDNRPFGDDDGIAPFLFVQPHGFLCRMGLLGNRWTFGQIGVVRQSPRGLRQSNGRAVTVGKVDAGISRQFLSIIKQTLRKAA